MKKNDWKKFWKKFWFVVWKDESFKGWVISIIFIFVLIKFVFFQVLSLTTGTELPLAIVESCSMYHEGNLLSNYNEWSKNHEGKYSKFEIGEQEFKDFKFKKGFNKGYILLVTGVNPKKLKIGDVVIFDGGANNPIIHRIIEIDLDKNTFSTIGDNNNGQLSFEKNIPTEKIIGKAQFKIAPYLGWMKLIFFENKKSFSEKGLCKER